LQLPTLALSKNYKKKYIKNQMKKLNN